MCAMLIRLECRNGLNKCKFCQMIKASKCRSYETHTYQWRMDLPGCFKHQKACLVEIEQTARKLETNAHDNFLMAENMAYQCMEDGRWNMPILRLSWLIVRFRHNVETKSHI